jgi:hypothetical protein
MENHYKVITLDEHYVYHICWLGVNGITQATPVYFLTTFGKYS